MTVSLAKYLYACVYLSEQYLQKQTYCTALMVENVCNVAWIFFLFCATAARTSAFSDACKHTVVSWPSLSQVVQQLLVARGLLPDNTDSGQLAVSLRVQAATLPDLR